MQTLLNGKINDLDARLPIGQYDSVIYSYWNNNTFYIAKNGTTGNTDFNSTDAASVFNQALENGNSVYVTPGEYTVNADIYLNDKKNARLDSDGATLNLNGHRIVIAGMNYQYSQNNQISGLIIFNGTVRVENSFRTTVTNMIFANCTVGLEVANTNTWSECTKIDTVLFSDCAQGIVFRTNTTGATSSYGNTGIANAYFNQLDNSVAITVERNAEFTNGQMQNIRIWMGEFGSYNQTGLLMYANSSMYQTLLDGVVFESFASGNLTNAAIYAVKINPCPYGTPILQAGVTFLGSWTARIYNPGGAWISGTDAGFKIEDVKVQVGTNSSYGETQIIQIAPATISSFQPQITVQGSFSQNETVTVRVRLEFVDNIVSSSVEKTFNSNATVWLSNNDLMTLFPSQDIIWAILVDAKVNSATTDATAQVSIYGTTN